MDRRLSRSLNTPGLSSSTHSPGSRGGGGGGTQGNGEARSQFYGQYPATGPPPRYQAGLRSRPPPLPVSTSPPNTNTSRQLHHSPVQDSTSLPTQPYPHHVQSQVPKRKRTPTPPRHIKRVKATSQAGPSSSSSEDDDDDFGDDEDDEDDEDGFDAAVIPPSDYDSDYEKNPAERELEKAHQLAARLILADPEMLMLQSDELEDSIAGTRLHFLKKATSRFRARR